MSSAVYFVDLEVAFEKEKSADFPLIIADSCFDHLLFLVIFEVEIENGLIFEIGDLVIKMMAELDGMFPAWLHREVERRLALVILEVEPDLMLNQQLEDVLKLGVVNVLKEYG